MRHGIHKVEEFYENAFFSASRETNYSSDLREKRRETYFKQSAEFGFPMKKCFERITRLK